MGSPHESQKDYHTLNDDDNKAILQQLIEESDEEVAKVISCYSIGASSKDIRQKLDKFNKPVLEKAANHLQLPTKDKKKLQLLDQIIRGIESLLMEACPICGLYYNNELGDIPYFRCIKCSQGCHNPCYYEIHTVMSGMDENIKNSFHFMCCSCSEQNKVINSSAEAKKHPVTAPHPNSQQKDSSLVEVLTPSQHRHIDSGLTQPNTSNEPSVKPAQTQPNKSQLPPSQPVTPKGNANANNKQDPEVPLCPNYKWGRCQNYENCKFRHPPRCWNWLSSGKCRFNNECKYHHPPLCKNSVKELKCFNKSCVYFHISKTLRRNADEENLRTALHQQRYSAQPKSQIEKPPDNQNKRQVQLQPNAPTNTPKQEVENSQPQPSDNNIPLNKENLTFLVSTIRDLLREDLKKELLDIKLHMNSIQPVAKLPNQQSNLWSSLQATENLQSQIQRFQVPSIQPLSQLQQTPNLLITSSQPVQTQHC